MLFNSENVCHTAININALVSIVEKSPRLQTQIQLCVDFVVLVFI